MALAKIMIVDDMPIFLEYLRGCIDWNSYGFEIWNYFSIGCYVTPYIRGTRHARRVPSIE